MIASEKTAGANAMPGAARRAHARTPLSKNNAKGQTMKAKTDDRRAGDIQGELAGHGVDDFVRALCRRFDPDRRAVLVAVVTESRGQGAELARAIESSGHEARLFNPAEWVAPSEGIWARVGVEVIAHGRDSGFPLLRALPKDRFMIEVLTRAALAQNGRAANAQSALHRIMAGCGDHGRALLTLGTSGGQS